MQKSAAARPALVRSCQPEPQRERSFTRAFSICTPAFSARSSIRRLRSKRE
jgi:hypothetical protein